jgi:hypothetical protein
MTTEAVLGMIVVVVDRRVVEVEVLEEDELDEEEEDELDELDEDEDVLVPGVTEVDDVEELDVLEELVVELEPVEELELEVELELFGCVVVGVSVEDELVGSSFWLGMKG